MARHLTPEEFTDLQSELDEGASRLHFTRSFSRRFFTNVGLRSVKEHTGLSILPEKTLVIALLVMSLLLLIACLADIYVRFGWLSLFVLPLVGIFWTVLAGFTTEMGSWLSSTASLLVVLFICFWLPRDYAEPAAMFATSVYLYRLGHILAFRFLSRLIARSYDAYDMLYEQIEVHRAP